MNERKRPWRMRVLLIALALIVAIAFGAIAVDGDRGPAGTATEQGPSPR
jgi:hypothetical protein